MYYLYIYIYVYMHLLIVVFTLYVHIIASRICFLDDMMTYITYVSYVYDIYTWIITCEEVKKPG